MVAGRASPMAPATEALTLSFHQRSHVPPTSKISARIFFMMLFIFLHILLTI